MADLSLDDFIKKKNVQVRVSNPGRGKFGQRGQRGSARGGVGRTQPVRVQTNKQSFVQQKLGARVGAGRGRGQPNRQTFDARQNLSAKAALTDARDKIIINKKSGKGDARNKIVSNQLQKGNFDARSLIKRHKKANPPKPGILTKQVVGFHNHDIVQANLPIDSPLTRTLSNPGAKSRGQVAVTRQGLTVTRSIPETQVSVRGGSLQVTRRNNRPAAKPMSAPSYRPAPASQPDFVPIIQIRNNRYREPESHGYPPYQPQPAYRDLDAPRMPAAVPDSLRPVEAAGMRPVSYTSQRSRAPPGAATLSAGKPTAGVKRRQPPPPALEVSGPLRLGRGGGPGVDLRIGDSHSGGPAIKRSRSGATLMETAVLQEDNMSSSDILSPLQGWRVLVTNLFNGVTQDDIIELFGAVGPLKKAKLLKSGSAEVVYMSRKDALSAVHKYHSRELDGQPMYVRMTTPEGATVKAAGGAPDPDITGEALRLYKKGSGGNSLPEAPIETPTIHRALFKAGPPAPGKSVKFTVKI